MICLAGVTGRDVLAHWAGVPGTSCVQDSAEGQELCNSRSNGTRAMTPTLHATHASHTSIC